MKRLLILLFTVTLSLGCMGAINGLTGLDLEFETGENAKHPDNFAMTPPANAEKLISMGMTAAPDSINLPEGIEVDLSAYDKVRMDMISYKVSDSSAATDNAVQEVTTAGYTSVPSEDASVHTFAKDGTMYLVVGANDGGEETVTMMRFEPRNDPEAAPPAE